MLAKIREKPELRKFSNLRRLEGSGIEDNYQERVTASII